MQRGWASPRRERRKLNGGVWRPRADLEVRPTPHSASAPHSTIVNWHPFLQRRLRAAADRGADAPAQARAGARAGTRFWSRPASYSAGWWGWCASAPSTTTSGRATRPTRSTRHLRFRTSFKICSAKACSRRPSFRSIRSCWPKATRRSRAGSRARFYPSWLYARRSWLPPARC